MPTGKGRPSLYARVNSRPHSRKYFPDRIFVFREISANDGKVEGPQNAAGEKTPLKMRNILTAVSIIHKRSAGR